MFQGSPAMQPNRPRYVIDRWTYTLPDFDTEFNRKTRQFPVGAKLSTLFRYRTTTYMSSYHTKDKCCVVIKQGRVLKLRLNTNVRHVLQTFSGWQLENLSSSKSFPLFAPVRCSVLRLKGLLFRHLPVLRWLPKYKAKENLLYDVISGVSAGTIQVPQGWTTLTAAAVLSAPHRNIILCLCYYDLSESSKKVYVFSRHGVCPPGKPPSCQRSLFLFLSPHPLFLNGHRSPDGPG